MDFQLPMKKSKSVLGIMLFSFRSLLAHHTLSSRFFFVYRDCVTTLQPRPQAFCGSRDYRADQKQKHHEVLISGHCFFSFLSLYQNNCYSVASA